MQRARKRPSSLPDGWFGASSWPSLKERDTGLLSMDHIRKEEEDVVLVNNS